ncbi:type ISP restriction/modification enzyme [Acinetobacter baumannii]|uniref:type ISP restriction/modification enzyme n=1 Tax=Acinetobacter baumannii TaxID=470 RepID=UPI000DE6FEBC|nr:type ISP restriction/modification enzyme [Acinetobacter baumannii]MDH2580084.1 N-6 DNA methylase [Acinetobacter baumannii]SSR05460.1 Predicted helicase [Acinetobacter baumannii]SSR14430.1 Predicted helicase [Acinetobacter baumannii]HDU8502987.1 N-6 DNA methylase [Acinetobacter baumannii]
MIQNYIQAVNAKFITGKTTEHSFRGDLQSLLESIIGSDYMVINEPKRQTCGAPDYIIEKKSIPIGFIEAKDIGDTDLEGKKKTGNKEQFDRYKASLNNIVFTNYLDFYFYQESELVAQVSIAEISGNQIKALPENFSMFESLIKNFSIYLGQTIKSPQKLAKMMANKAKLLAEILEKAVTNDEDTQEDSTLKAHFEGFKQILIHDIKPKGFADVYAQTIAYGMFAARLHDSTLKTFSRQEAAELIPKSNPFLRRLFGYIAGPDIDDRIKWIVDSLADIFLHCNVEEILKTYGRSTRMNNPIIHFYETFLSEYDPKERKKRGVWYTPEPVVDFIVRAVDEVLKTDFGVASGLADTAKTTIKIKNPTTDRRHKDGYITTDKEVHKVQILDPATGTGTFLSHVIKHIYQDFEGMQGIWSNYVEKDLIPRLNGFELLMASYAMAHLQLNLLLSETGYKPQGNKEQRLKVYLTNSLEESHPDTGTLFANWLSAEANEANHIKRDTPVMCIIGNPPYSVSSSNKGEWITDLIKDYKKDLNERNIQPLSDDYIKFIRFGQYFIEKNGYGVLAYISNNSFVNGLIHRQMRKSLGETFDKIYIIDLHGNSNQQEEALDGGIDQNVFDIKQGVSINIFIKSKSTKQKIQIFHTDLYGKRDLKYKFLQENNLKSIKWNKVIFQEPNYFFESKNLSNLDDYNKGFSLSDLFIVNGSGIKTQRDDASICFTQQGCDHIKNDLISLDHDSLRRKYGFKDVRDWTIDFAKNDLNTNKIIANKILYRPFDIRYMNYTGKTKGVMGYPRYEVMKHMIKGENLGLLLSRQNKSNTIDSFLVTNLCSEMKTGERTIQSYHFPLYLYSETDQIELEDQPLRKPNLNLDIIQNFEKNVGFTFIDEKEDINATFSPVDLLDYIYAILYSPKYREAYKEFLKIDFPKIPYPKNTKIFVELMKLGGQLRMLHLMDDSTLRTISQYPESGDNVIEKHIYKDCNVYINDEQYFANVPEVAWNFYIGGYQPAQKWLKDRKGQALQFEDIKHYQKIIATLQRTSEIMEEIDQIDFM